MHLKKATSKPYRVWESVWGAVITRQTIKNNKRKEECRTTICRVEVKGGVNQTRGQTTVKGKIWQQVEWNLYVCFFYLVPVSTSFCSRLSRVGGSRTHGPPQTLDWVSRYCDILQETDTLQLELYHHEIRKLLDEFHRLREQQEETLLSRVCVVALPLCCHVCQMCLVVWNS